MDLVVDANVFISGLISPKGRTAELFFSDKFKLIAPEYLKHEIEKHKKLLIQKSSLSNADFDLAFTLLSLQIAFIPFSEFAEYVPQAMEVCPDPNDVEYFAVALKFRCPLWSNDKRLAGQKEVKVVSTIELLQLL